jgi:ABC-2 type transport system ATP-binding protein
MPRDDCAIHISGLRKTYPAAGGAPERHALRGVDLTVASGEICCILGPNGAGKTTLISILLGLLYPDAGSGRVCGFNLRREQRKIRAAVNFTSGHANFPDNFTVDEMLNYFGMLYGLPRAARRRKADELTELFEIQDHRQVPFNRLSTGLKQRLALAKSLLNDPQVLFLDEPTVGLDPQVCLSIRSRLRQLNAERGTTIVLTTHQMDEAEQLSHRIAFLKDGQFVRSGESGELKRSIGFQERIVIRGRGLEGVPQALALISGIYDVERTSEQTVRWRMDSRQERLNSALAAVLHAGAVIEHIEISEPTLGDVFVALANQPHAE